MNDMKNANTRKKYQAPRLVVHGDVAAITGFNPLDAYMALGKKKKKKKNAPKPS
jgi:hypothetical protein